MIGYTVNENRRTLGSLRAHGWRILLSPSHPQRPAPDFSFAIDNGAWRSHNRGLPFDTARFESLLERSGSLADWIVAPDIVAGGRDSLVFSLRWLPRLRQYRRVLLPVQDGMTPDEVGRVLRDWPALGIFLGGSTDWKLRTMYQWGVLACSARRYYHVGRVNSVRRVRLAAEAGADSFDGSSAAIFLHKVARLDPARLQPSLLVPSTGCLI